MNNLKEETNQIPIEISAEVQSTIEQVISSDDPLDKHDFNLISYINQMFPNEQSLANVDEVLNKMKEKIRFLDDEIRTVVRKQNVTEEEGKEALKQAQEIIVQLISRISSIKDKAKNSQRMVDEITCDIKQLDNAKRNLTLSIVMLNNLHILVKGVSKLDKCIDQRNYNQIAAILQSLIGVLSQLNKYRNNPHIKKLANEVDSLKNKLYKQIMTDFDNILDDLVSKQIQPVHLKLLAEACLVIDTLGKNEKDSFFEWFINLQLKEYKNIFTDDNEISWLDKIDKRFTWLKTFLSEFDDKFGKTFPLNWKITECISSEFCKLTAKHLINLMNKRKIDIDVKLLLFAFNKTNEFEIYLGRKFSCMTLVSHDINAKLPSFTGLISYCYEPYLNIYVECQDKKLGQIINEFVEEMNKNDNSTKNKSKMAEVIPSSGVLFTQYKNFLVQCVKLSNKKPLYLLSITFQKYLKEYANKVLISSLPKTSFIGGSNTIVNSANMFTMATSGILQSLLKEGDDYKFTNDELIQICSVLLTSNYCLETIQQLEKKLHEKIDKKFLNKIDMKPEQNLFQTIINNCINLLLQHIEAGYESAFNTMVKIQWNNVQTPTGPCTYVTMITQHLQKIFPFIRENLQDSRKHFAQLCNTFATSFTLKFHKCLFKCKPLKEAAAEQLLHDTHTLKKVLLGLPGYESTIKTSPKNYARTIVKGMEKAEKILQVILVPTDKIDNFISSYIKLLPDSSLIEFLKISEMKDVKKTDLIKLTDAYKLEIESASANGEENFD